MKKFLITTEVKHTVTYVYEVEAKSIFEAEEKIIHGEMRGDGNVTYEYEECGTEIRIATNPA